MAALILMLDKERSSGGGFDLLFLFDVPLQVAQPFSLALRDQQ